MFKGSGIYTEAGNGIVDTILVDEAHRLNEKSGMFQNLGENQIKEIINGLPSVDYEITDEVECIDFSYMSIENVVGEGFGSKPKIIIEEAAELNANS